jgi:hypothetical protein
MSSKFLLAAVILALAAGPLAPAEPEVRTEVGHKFAWRHDGVIPRPPVSDEIAAINMELRFIGWSKCAPTDDCKEIK